MKKEKVLDVSLEQLRKLLRDTQKQSTKSRWLFTQNVKGKKRVNFRQDEQGVWWTGNWAGLPRETDMVAHWVADERCLYVGSRSSLPPKPGGTNKRGVVCYAIPMEKVQIFQVTETGPEVNYSSLLKPEGSANGPQGYLYWPDPTQIALDAIAKTVVAMLPDFGEPDVTEILREVFCRTATHARFKKKLCKRWDNRCALTGVNISQLLVASHIKPWADCKATPHERIDVDNGLLLLSPIDKLFDRGFISFDKKGELLLHKKRHPRHLSQVALGAFGLTAKDSRCIKKRLSQETLKFLEFHRENVFYRK